MVEASKTMLSMRKDNKDVKLNFVFIGNPGSGKSTTLNSLICPQGGKPKFESGVSLGGGMTQELQEFVDLKTNCRFLDTPGLSDVELRKKAAECIRAALQMDGTYQIFFVITLESGRIRPDDKTTMKLVLDACPMVNNCYSIIVNKVESAVVKKLEKEKDKLMALLNKDVPGTQHVYFNPYDPQLAGEDGVFKQLDPTFLTFLMNAPTIYINKEKVGDIKDSEFDLMKEELEKKASSLEKNAAAMLETIAENNKRMEAMAESQRIEREKHLQELKQVQEKMAQKMAEEKREFEEQLRKAKDQETQLLLKTITEMNEKNAQAMRECMAASQRGGGPGCSIF